MLSRRSLVGALSIRKQRRWLDRCRNFSGSASGARVGFIGLGNMGFPMAANLVKAGYDVLAFDVDAKRVRSLAEAGATPASSVEQVGTSSDIIVTMLPNTPHVESVYSAEGRGLLACVGPGTLLLDSSTIDPLASRRLNQGAAARGAVMMDAPVSGGVPASTAGTLTFMVGGPEEGLSRARPILEAMGKNVVHCGEAGAGCVAKVCNNLALAISMIGVSEAMSLGSKMGMDPKVLASVLNTSSARCWSSDTYNPCPGVMEGVPSSRQYEGGFAAALMEKDLHLALQAARASEQPLPMGAAAHQMYSLMCAHGASRKDFSGVYEFIGAAKPKK